MRVWISGRWLLVGLVGFVLVASAACGKKTGAEKAFSAAKAASESLVPSNAQNDYMKPYLTDEKVTKFIESLQEDVNPFEVLFKQGGQMRSMSEISARAEEFNSFARKYGFADYADYTIVWGRIMVGDMLIASEQMTKDTIKTLEESIRSAEENLKKPDLSAEMRTIYEDQITSGKSSIEEFKKSDTSGLNEADLALVAKYKAQIDEATKRFK
jgi:uncharacterized protein YqeY